MAALTAAALLTAVQARYDDQRLKELTNPRNRAGASINATKLTQACTGALAWFHVYAQAEADDATTEHVEAACDGVVACLQKWGGASAGVKRIRWDDWADTCRDLAKVGPRGHVPPETSSILEPTEPDTSAGPVKPAFDSSYFDRMTPTRNGEGRPDIDT